MNDTETRILTRCYELQLAILENEVPEWETWNRPTWEEERDHGPQYQVSEWFGPLPERARVHYRRTIQALEKQGLLKIWRRWSLQMTNVRLTPKGQKIAKQLTATQTH